MSELDPLRPLSSNSRKIPPGLKFLLELGPLIGFFFLSYKGKYLIEKFSFLKFFDQPIFLATAFFLPATLLAFALSWHFTKKIPLMALVTAIFILIFGSLTLWFHDALFIKIKPTLINLLFSAILFGGLYFKKPILPYLFEDSISLTTENWQKLTYHFALFFLFLALSNEIIRRYFSTEIWASFKAFGTPLLSFIFLLTQMPILLRDSNISSKKHPEEKQ